MKHILAISLLLVANSAMANVIRHPTDLQILQYVTYRESRGEPVETIRAVLDVVNNRSKKNHETIYVTIHKPNQFPYIKRTGIRKVKDKIFLTKFWKAFTMPPVLTSEALYFNHYKNKHEFATKHKRIGNLVFSREKEKK